MTTFSEFADQNVYRSTTLLEITPKEKLSNWTQQGGLTSTYYVGFESNIEAVSSADTLYRQISSVHVDDTQFVRVNNEDGKYGVTNTPGSWYLDTSTDKLYVRCSDDSDPDDNVVAFAKFKLHFATSPEIISDVFYDGRVIGDDFPSITQDTEELFFGIEKRVGGGSISLSNGDALFDRLSANWIWKNAPADVFIAYYEQVDEVPIISSAYVGSAVVGVAVLGQSDEGTSVTDTSYKYVGKMKAGSFLVESLTPNYDKAEVVLRDLQSVTLQKIPPQVITLDAFQYAADDAVGVTLPLIYGIHTGVPAYLENTHTYKGRYVFGAFNYMNAYAITAVYDDGVLVDPVYYLPNLPGCRITFYTAYPTTPGVITCDVIGSTARGRDYETSTDYLKYYGEIMGEIYSRVLGVPVESISNIHALEADASRAEQNVFIDSYATARSYIRKIEAGVLGRTFLDSDGNVKPTIFEPGIATTSSIHITDPDIKSFDVNSDVDSVFSRTSVFYNRDIATGNYEVVEDINEYTEYLVLDGDDTKKFSVETFLANTGDAQALAGRLNYIARQPRLDVTFEETGMRLMESNVGDLIRLTLSRSPSSTGSWDEKTVMISKIVKKLGPVPSTVVTVNDLEGLGADLLVGTWSTVGTTWSTATTFEKDTSGWWSDTNGYVDPADKSTKNISVWW